MIRAGRGTLAVSLAVVVTLAPVVSGPAEAARRPRPAPTPDPRPDAALYAEAQQALATLRASPARQGRKPEWEKVVLRFRRVVARYPQSAYSDNALLAVGDLYRDMARRFDSRRYEEDAVAAYRALVAEYPSSRLGEKALFSVVEIARGNGDRKDVLAAARAYLDAYPESPRAAEVKSATRKGARPQEATHLPEPPPPGLAQVFNVRFWSGESSTRVVLDVEKAVRFKYDRISDPDRLWIDLDGTRLHPNLVGRAFPVGDGLLEKVRIGQNRDRVVRMVLDFKNVRNHNVFYLENPTRLVVDVTGAARSLANPIASGPVPAGAGPARTSAPEPFDLPAEATAEKLPLRRVAGLSPPRSSPATRATTPPVTIAYEPPRRPAASPSPGLSAPLAPPVAVPAAASHPPPITPAVRTARRDADVTAPLPPQVNRAGSYSLARQLGLGARRIVIDAGHGGHDPGTIGRGGLQEKDLVLDVALRLERLVRSELRAEVVLTRGTDVFIPLEERTAVANARGADLFLSIHANSSRSRSARGVETYFLSFAQDPHAEEVAARENAISAATLKDLQNLVKAIALNSKIDESRDFAASVQEAMVAHLRPYATAGFQDRGVRTAPFYVLIGANMPSILAEISFVSNPDEERLLRTEAHRDRIARSLLDGVRTYLDSLNRTQTRQLTGTAPRSTLASGGRR